MAITTNYLPPFPSRYVHPGLPRETRLRIAEERKAKMDAVITFLANLQIPTIPMKRKASCKAPCSNMLCDLASYIVIRSFQTLKSIFCCCFRSKDTTVKYKPIPQRSAEILESTQQQFERNTCGVCCIAPAVIVASPFIPATTTVTILLNILSGLVITTTAGTNTYVFSGNIGIVPDGHGKLIVQGGIPVDGHTIIETAFSQLAAHLQEKWMNASREQKIAIYKECLTIAKMERWDSLVDSIIDCGVPKTAVEKILNPFSEALTTVIDVGAVLFTEQLEVIVSPSFSPGTHMVIVDQATEGKTEIPLSTD